MGRGSECGFRARWGHGRATWLGIPANVRECARAGPRRVTGKAELIEESHGVEREEGHAREGDCHTQFWKVNRMRTMYVPGSELTYTALT
jgi:hypothetical protein